MTNLEWLRTAPEEEVAELLDDIDIGGYFTDIRCSKCENNEECKWCSIKEDDSDALWWLTQPLDRCKYYEVCGNKENCKGCKGKETV